tara:strand:- start:98 stop:1057 length:960 start_codon:yes stop_codon:yes gene_type:complete
MNKILVIGGAGYIGSHLVYELCDNGYNVTVLDNLTSGFEDNIDKRSKFIKDSYTNYSLMNIILKEYDTVIFLAALKAAGESMVDPLKYSQKNIIDSLKLINLCVKNTVKNFIFSSSAAVYGLPKYLPIDENHDLNPINYYGFTKLSIENQLIWYSKLGQINIGILRYFNAAGYDVDGRVFMKEKNPQNLLPILMEVASGIRKKISIYGNDYDTKDGTCLRDYIHVNDLATGHTKAIEALHDKKLIVVNLATGNYYSVLDVIKSSEIIINKKINYNFVGRRLGDPPQLFSKSNLAKKILDWEPKLSDLNNIIKSMWEVYK